MIVINNMCDKMNIPKLFKKTFKPHSNDKPDDYRTILRPTSKNFYSFIVSLEKAIVHNLNIKTFTTKGTYINTIERKYENGQPKGSLNMLSEWLKKNISTPEDLEKLIINPLKRIRKIRQIPAHEMFSNEYDRALYKQQNEIIVNTYGAIRAIRLFFANHPLNRDIDIPEYLVTGEKIVIY